MNYQFYFLCVGGTHGGPEAIHQIVDKINSTTDYSAHVVYFQKDFKPEEKFSHLRADYLPLSQVPDTKETVLCVSETHTYYLRKFKNAKKVIVWLSLDYYLRNIALQNSGFKEMCNLLYYRSRLPKPFYPLLFVRDRLFRKKKHFVFDMEDVLHTQNCEYVSAYLRQNGVKDGRMIFLDGPVRQEYFDLPKVKKEDVAAYNPAKGAERYVGPVLDALGEKYPQLKLIPIKNMTVDEVRDTLLRAKVYFDFGCFPGPEKLVKEAALCGCNIITGIDGAAGNKKDILIRDECKIDVANTKACDVAKVIFERADRYEEFLSDYDNYRKHIKNLSDSFDKTVKDFVNFAVK